MRPTRLLLSICFVFVAVILTVYSIFISSSENVASSSSGSKGSLKALFSWSMPSTLFPQSAIISLTDDNSTFFLSRPAAYGPRLPNDGLSGQLWIGSGFNEEAVVRGAVAQGEGELGCSDIPGWDARQSSTSGDGGEDQSTSKEATSKDHQVSKERQSKVAGSSNPQKAKENKRTPQPREDDGTDDYLHWPLKATTLKKYILPAEEVELGGNEHADIQSLQESAEIKGKVVLLSRGGCGFLEKTKWVQRRGGVALIVGDNTRGGPLTTMYASGDASNISIPSVFTTRTTAHLLSSLIPGRNSDGTERTPKGDDLTAKLEQSKAPLKVKASPEAPKAGDVKSTKDNDASKSRSKVHKRSPPIVDSDQQSHDEQNRWFSWLSNLGLGIKTPAMSSDSSRPPSSGRIKWVVSEDWNDEPVAQRTGKKSGLSKTSQVSAQNKEFVIGVQDWRDPDMITADASGKSATQQNSKLTNPGMPENGLKQLEGGSHTPGSGIYNQADKTDSSTKEPAEKEEAESSEDRENHGWLGRMFSGSDIESSQDSEESISRAKEVYDKKIGPQYVEEQDFKDAAKKPTEHEGLWVTMTPTTVSTTPFFDTLLVLVISPLVTLTIVYAMLLLRSRIRRRRWRAPKSVVERLPVRTYHTMSHSSSATSSHVPSPEGSSPSSPLLQTSKTMLSRSRPRSRTTSTLTEHVSTSLDKATKANPSKGERKRFGPKRYRGRQSECVVCLEEYVDGQSRVMSLPCGHEFHVECITPWLTTRRRTCPICKGDVVRSLAGDSSSSSTTDLSALPLTTEHVTSDEIQSEAAQTRNDSASAAIPIPGGDSTDLERGDDMAATLVNDQQSGYSTSRGWRELASRSLSVVRGDWSRSAPVDRDR